MRAIRSMQNGSIDGRIVSAYPVKPDVVEEEDYDQWDELDEEETDDGGGGGGGDGIALKPWTDYYTAKSSTPVHTFGLSKTPYVNEKMASGTRDYSSVHVYWNGVFQRDMSYSLEDSVITVMDETMRIHEGDQLIVKYFYEQEEGGQVDPNQYRMQCWFNRHETTPLDRPGYYIFGAGTESATKVGINSGSITTLAGRYYTLQSTGSWNCAFRHVPGNPIPTGDDVKGITWRVSYDTGATISMDVPGGGPDLYIRGTNFGEIICHKTCCGFEVGGDGCYCGSDNLPILAYEMQQAPFNPTFGPIGGTVFCSGEYGIELAKYVNHRSRTGPDTHGVWFNFEMPVYPNTVPYNAGCTYAGGIANAEDTIYGKHSHERATYNVKIGVTATVVRK